MRKVTWQLTSIGLTKSTLTPLTASEEKLQTQKHQKFANKAINNYPIVKAPSHF